MTYKTYRMYRGKMVYGSDLSGFFGDNFTSTTRTFKGRNNKEATRKMDKFIKQAQITGSFFVKEIE